jgi:vacuolar-type H+-ATPase subunit H
MDKETHDKEAFRALQRIKEAEEKAQRILQEAREKISSQILQDAYGEAVIIREKYMKEAREEAEKRKKELIEKAQKEMERIKKKAEEDAFLLSQRAEALITKAVERIRERLREYLKTETH